MIRWFIQLPRHRLAVAHAVAAIVPGWAEQKPTLFNSPAPCSLEGVEGRLVDEPVNRCAMCERAVREVWR